VFKKILCFSDLRDESTASIIAAVQLARSCGGEIVLLNVRPEFMEKEEMVMLRTSAGDFLKEEADIAVAARKKLELLLASAGGDDLPHEIILRGGEPHHAILETAGELQCDLIVITSGSSGHLLSHLKGSTSERVIAGAQIPVLVFPADTHQRSDRQSD
jgi:nucleotide-binding universal stress UspA family protein